MTPRPPSCRTETVDVDGVRVTALVRATEAFDEHDRTVFAEQVRAARRRHRARTTLVPLPTKFSITRALRAYFVSERERRDAARAVHELLTGDEAWVIADPAPASVELGDEVPVRWLDGRGYHHGRGVLTPDDAGGLRVELLRADRGSDTPEGPS